MTRLQAIDRLQPSDPLASLLIADVDDAGGYFGFLSMTGAWMIKRYQGGAMRYAFGVDDYASAWSNRASITYNLPNQD